MDVQPGDVADEIKRLRRCINDLVSLFALPAMWSGAEPSQIVHTLLDALQRMLQLDLVYVRLRDSGGQAPIEMVRFAQSQERAAQPHEIGEAFKHWLGADPRKWPPLIRNPIGGRDISIMPLGLGLQGEIGEIVAGPERADFPWQTERLILSVAANQASIGLQGARLLSEQKHVASELDRRVAQRTAELAAANEELRQEIADRKRAEEALGNARAELAHVNRVMTMGELTASIAHEVNQPLASIIASGDSCAAWLASEPPNLGRARAAASRVIQAATQASETVLRLRALFQRTPSMTTSVDVNGAIEDTISLVRHEAQRNKVVLRSELESSVPSVSGDRVQLQQVILNLTMNGIESVAHLDLEPRWVMIRSARSNTGELLVSVEDTGLGIEAEHAERLFAPFFTTKPQGIGMGLSISRSIIETHGGRLWAAANQPRGAVFHFVLPAATNA
jgi:signal transduction histidine kinase